MGVETVLEYWSKVQPASMNAEGCSAARASSVSHSPVPVGVSLFIHGVQQVGLSGGDATVGGTEGGLVGARVGESVGVSLSVGVEVGDKVGGEVGGEVGVVQGHSPWEKLCKFDSKPFSTTFFQTILKSV